MPGPANSPPGQLQADPTFSGMSAWSVSLGPGGLFTVSSFNLKSRVHPVTMAQNGSSVNGGSVSTLGAFAPGSRRGPLAWLWHLQRLGHACPHTTCRAQAQSTSSGIHICPGHRAAVCSVEQVHGPSASVGRSPWSDSTCMRSERCVCLSLLVQAKGSGPCGLLGHKL